MTGQQPNILLIIIDDQRYDTMAYSPRTQARIFDQGVTFTNAYVTTPVSGPSRASILTGMYAHHHGVYLIDDPFLEENLVARLREAGYHTGMVGKYLNYWSKFQEDPPPPEYDFWAAVLRKGAEGYVKPLLNVNGTQIEHQDYQTYVLRDYALQFLDEASRQQKPFLLIFAPYAVHRPAVPAPGDENLHPNLPPYRPPSFNEEDISDKPAWLAEYPPLSPEEIADIDDFRRGQLQTLNAVDEAVESLLLELERQGVLDDTVVIYTSDGGFAWGEHRRTRHYLPYEEAIRMPLAVRYPPLVDGPREETRLVANVDIAPTIYDLVGLSIPPGVDGRSLVPLVRETGDWRDALLIEFWGELDEEDENAVPFLAVHTGRYVYVETAGDRPELYDLKEDPYQLQNQADNPDYAEVLAGLKERLDEEKAQVEPPPPRS